MTHTLTFSSLVGEFYVDKELIGGQDPYVIFESGSQKCQTKAIKSVGVGTAEWKETYTLNSFSPKSSSILDIHVYNHNTLRPDSIIGSGKVDLATLGQGQLSGGSDRVTVPLTDKKSKSVGELKFVIHGGGYTGSGSASGTTSQTGYGSQQGYGSQTGYGSGSQTGSGITGVGAGQTYSQAKSAADKAAIERHEVTTEGARGQPVGGAGYSSSTGTGAGHSSGTGAGAGYGSGLTGGHTSGTTGSASGVTGVASGVRGVDNVKAGDVIDRKYYTGTEVRDQDQALVEQYRVHNPYAKSYETTVQHTGRERLVGSNIEALGSTERVVGTDHQVHANPLDHIARALPKGAVSERPGGEGWVQGKAGPICDSTTFEVQGDRIVDKERITNLQEHREFEKEFEVKTSLKGERAVERGATTEQLNRERVLLEEDSKNACAGHPDVNAAPGLTGSSAKSGTSGATATSTKKPSY